jgi:hypothetical protein
MQRESGYLPTGSADITAGDYLDTLFIEDPYHVQLPGVVVAQRRPGVASVRQRMGVHVAEPRHCVGSPRVDYRVPIGVVLGRRRDRGDSAAFDGDVNVAAQASVADVDDGAAAQNRALGDHLLLISLAA